MKHLYLYKNLIKFANILILKRKYTIYRTTTLLSSPILKRNNFFFYCAFGKEIFPYFYLYILWHIKQRTILFIKYILHFFLSFLHKSSFNICYNFIIRPNIKIKSEIIFLYISKTQCNFYCIIFRLYIKKIYSFVSTASFE